MSINSSPLAASTSVVARTRHLDVTLSRRPILRGVDVSVMAGEVVAILGANGSGKSTLVKALLGLIPKTAGEVELFGTPLERFDQWSRIGYVPQVSTISQGVAASAREIVASGRLSRRRPLVPPTRADKDAVAHALAAVALTDRAQQPVATLSGGQQQRVLIARALAGEPEFLLMDEPNAGVDLANQQAIANTLERLTQQGTTLVLVLHELGPFAPWIQRSIVLSEGRVSHDGPPSASHRFDDHHHRLHTANPSASEGLIRGDR